MARPTLGDDALLAVFENWITEERNGEEIRAMLLSSSVPPFHVQFVPLFLSLLLPSSS